jgi:hypothetical protein
MSELQELQKASGGERLHGRHIGLAQGYRTCDAKDCAVEFRAKRRDQRFCSEVYWTAAWKRVSGLAPKKRRLEALPSSRREALPSPKTLPAIPLRGSVAGGGFPSPTGNKNAFKNGHHTAEAIARRREVGVLLRAMRALAKLE